ncbi:putative Effector-associated domain-containing protein [Frankia sp. AiPs1]
MVIASAGLGLQRMGISLIPIGCSVIGLAFLALGLCAMLLRVPPERPRPASPKRLRRARARSLAASMRLASLTTAPTHPVGPLPVELLASDVAWHDQLVGRSRLASLPPFLVMSLGFLVASTGVLLRGFATPGGPALDTAVGQAALVAVYLLFLALAVGLQRRWSNSHPRVFAVHHLLRTVELCLPLAESRSIAGADVHGDGPVDIDLVRRHGVMALGQSSRFLYRMFGQRQPGLGAAELASVRRRATALERVVRGIQETFVSASSSEVIAAIPKISDFLSAVVNQRFTDLPGGHERDVAIDAPSEVGASASDSLPVGMRSDDMEVLRRELAELYPTSESADVLLTRIGYPRARRMSIDHHGSDEAWHGIFRALGQGAVADPYRRLLAGALAKDPTNSVLLALARRYDVPPAAELRRDRGSGRDDQ